jgi:hypothetical protein
MLGVVQPSLFRRGCLGWTAAKLPARILSRDSRPTWSKVERLAGAIVEVRRQLESVVMDAAQHIEVLRTEVDALKASRPWRATAPFRGTDRGTHQLKWGCLGPRRGSAAARLSSAAVLALLACSARRFPCGCRTQADLKRDGNRPGAPATVLW